MILTVSNHKGGVGKTTVSTLLAAYAAKKTNKKILLIDVDHNRGSSSIFFTNKEPEYSIMDVFEAYEKNLYDSAAITELMKSAAQKVPYYENLYVVQASRKLAQLPSLGLETDALKEILEISHFDRFPLVIIDSGNVPDIVSKCITACDKLLIPIMMSQQCIGPTKNTITLARRKRTEVLGLLPLTVGKSKWDIAILENWKAVIESTPELGWDLGLMEGIPQSKTIVRADLASGNFPKVAVPVMETILESLGIEREN